MEPNPVSIQVEDLWNGEIKCQANASFFQRVTVVLTATKFSEKLVFSGTGEKQAMTLPNGAISYPLGPNRGGYRASCLFEFSPFGSGGPFQNASVLAPTEIETPIGMFIQIQSEDSVDNDYNDSVLAFVPVTHSS